ncbi:MAG: alpha-amylase [Alphaproteobacteria bacterium]|nr:MAG: alpha-amylase [Alphaproteobacteria bacterium]
MSSPVSIASPLHSGGRNRRRPARWRRCLGAGVCLGLGAIGLGAVPGWSGDVTNDVDYTRDVVYQIVTDRFVNGDSTNDASGALASPGCTDLRKYCGGDWAGIIQKIEDGYLTDMGIGAIWISQPVENVFALTPDATGATSYHGFWARDYKRPNPFFGTFADFANLISVAHAHGIKVIIDFTPNHTSPSREGDPTYMEDGALYDDGIFIASLNNDPDGVFHHNGGTDFSTYEDGIYRGLFDLADYNQQNPTLDAYMKAAIALWLDQGVDGVRVDAVKHMPPGWAKSWVDALYAHRPVFTFGEWFLGVGEVDPLNHRFANESGMSLLDFRYAQMIRQVLRDGSASWYDFDAMIQGTAADYEQVIDQLPFIDNHDMARFHYAGADPRRTDMALAVLLTSRGVPVIYYGTEQYMTGSGDPDNRAMMTGFDRTTRAYQVIRKLSALRAANPALAWGATQQRWINNDVYIFERRFRGHVVLVAVNRSTTTGVTITGLYTALAPGGHADVLGGLLDGQAITVNADGSVTPFVLAPGEVAVWETNVTEPGPAIGHVGPMTGRVGATVTIDGEGFGTQAGQVFFGATAASVLSWTDGRITARVPSLSGGLYDVTVKTANGVTSAAYSRFEVLSGPQVSVRFIVDNATTFFGQNVYLTGSVHELGNWSTADNIAIGPLFNQVEESYPSWYFDVSVPAGKWVEFKFIKKDGAGNVVWEGGWNHGFTTPASGTGTIRVNWQN